MDIDKDGDIEDIRMVMILRTDMNLIPPIKKSMKKKRKKVWSKQINIINDARLGQLINLAGETRSLYEEEIDFVTFMN